MSAYESQVYLSLLSLALVVCTCIIAYHIRNAIKVKKNNRAVQSLLDSCNFNKSYTQVEYDYETDTIIMSKPSKKEMIDSIVSVGLEMDEKRNVYKPSKRRT